MIYHEIMTRIGFGDVLERFQACSSGWLPVALSYAESFCDAVGYTLCRAAAGCWAEGRVISGRQR